MRWSDAERLLLAGRLTPSSASNPNTTPQRKQDIGDQVVPIRVAQNSGSAWWGATSSGIPPRTLRWSTASPRWPKTPEPCATCSGPRGTRGMSSRPTDSPQPDRRPVGRGRWQCSIEGAARSTLTNELASLAQEGRQADREALEEASSKPASSGITRARLDRRDDDLISYKIVEGKYSYPTAMEP